MMVVLIAAIPLLALLFGVWRLSQMAGIQGVFGLADRVHRASTAQDYLLIQGIHQGVVDLGSHEYRALVRVEPLNFWLLSEEEQDRLQGLWRAFVDAQREPFTLVSLARRVDVRDPLQAWRTPLPQPNGVSSQMPMESPAIGAYYQDVVSDVSQRVQSGGLLTRAHYLVLHWRPSSTQLTRQTEFRQTAEKALTVRRQEVAEWLTRMGLTATPLDTTETLQVFYDVYNRDRARHHRMKDVAASGVSTLFTTAPRHGA